MFISEQPLAEITRYIDRNESKAMTDNARDYERYIRHMTKFHAITKDTKILEIGIGTGWFPLQCTMNGLNCKGLEISPQLVKHARASAALHGVELDLELGNIEESDLGEEVYDVIIAMSVFEHVQYWRQGLQRVYRALRPGGILLFESTNKFSLTSGEYTGFPLYGWWPDALRYAVRIARHGESIMRLGIDFNQFRYSLLRCEFRRLGFQQIYDRLSLVEPQRIAGALKRLAGTLCVRTPSIGRLALTFMPTTNFVCVK